MRIKEFIYRTVKKYLNENFDSDKIIAYHGTDNNYNVFDDNKPIFFVEDPEIAKTYGNKIIKAELNINNPIIFDFQGNSTVYFLNKWFIPSELANKIKEISEDIKQHYKLEDDVVDELNYHDYDDKYGDLDGIIMKNISDAYDGVFSEHKSTTNYVVFDKNQIKIIR